MAEAFLIAFQTIQKEVGTKVPNLMHFIVWLARRSGWLDILIPCYTDDSGYPNQLCGDGTTKSNSSNY